MCKARVIFRSCRKSRAPNWYGGLSVFEVVESDDTPLEKTDHSKDITLLRIEVTNINEVRDTVRLICA